MTPQELQDRLLAQALGQKELAIIKQQVLIQTLQQEREENKKAANGSLDDLKELREGGD